MDSQLEYEMDKMMYEERSRAMPGEKDKAGCSVVSYQDVDVCIPVTIKAFGEAGNAKTECIGKPVITKDCDVCPGKIGGLCKFTISQKLRVEVPVIFGARAEIGEAAVDCGCGEGADGPCGMLS